ncbi:hypothetical protein H0H92_009990 [Tricholoma furcatifolium]|nr:hypothetical protein H0H92_009990 [Tricholoma furcatifolium]
MFSSLGLLHQQPCPDASQCTRSPCIFSHRTTLPPQSALSIPILAPQTVPAKRPIASSSTPSAAEPARKVQKISPPSRPAPVSPAKQSGPPVLRINAAHSVVAVPVRQAMLTTLYNHFVVLYHHLLPKHPNLASEHSLKQEEEIYKKSSKLTYRNAVIMCAAALKRREIPHHVSDDSVGTEAEVAARIEARKSRKALRLTRDLLQPYLMSPDDMLAWGYFLDLPEGPGGSQPSLEGKTAKCERCTQPFLVKRREEADNCIYHWGKPFSTKLEGQKTRLYSCCSRPVADSEGCTHGPHVFYESKLEDLHARHPFSFLQSSSSSALDVAALDCEMVYSTGGMRVARVSVVDGAGKEVFDELVRMDDGVEIIDFITRFSGITPEIYAKAILPLASIRKSLGSFIDANTILIGHALDNDLKTLRIIHHKCIDTVALFPHRMGAPYRRSLKDLVREHLGILIQSDSTAGHSSVEDAAATLDLVRHFILNKPSPPHSSPT